MKKTLIGQILSDKMTNTVVVTVKMWKKNRLLGKRYAQDSKFLADNPMNQYHLGDWVKIEETKPISRRKHFKVIGPAKKQ